MDCIVATISAQPNPNAPALRNAVPVLQLFPLTYLKKAL